MPPSLANMSLPAVSPAEDPVVEIPLERMSPDPFQPRTSFTETAVRALADSIQQHGLLQPLLVRPMQGPNSKGRYWIVGGERRFRAAQMLGMTSLPCRVRPYENMAAAVIALAENVHREDLSEIDKAAALLRIKTLTDRTWDEVAELVKLSRDYVKRLAGLMKLEESVKEKVRNGQISVRTAIALRPLPLKQQVAMAERILREGLGAEEVREVVRQQKLRRRGIVPEAEEEAPSTEARTLSVSGQLREAALQVAEIDAWLDSRDWPPSRVTAAQRKQLEALYEATSLLQQHLVTLRRPLSGG